MTVALVLAIVRFAVLVRSIWGFGDGVRGLLAGRAQVCGERRVELVRAGVGFAS